MLLQLPEGHQDSWGAQTQRGRQEAEGGWGEPSSPKERHKDGCLIFKFHLVSLQAAAHEPGKLREALSASLLLRRSAWLPRQSASTLSSIALRRLLSPVSAQITLLDFFLSVQVLQLLLSADPQLSSSSDSSNRIGPKARGAISSLRSACSGATAGPAWTKKLQISYPLSLKKEGTTLKCLW